MKTKKIANLLERADGTGALNVTNLRPGAGGSLTAIGADAHLRAYGGWRPLWRLTDGRMPRYLMCRSGELAVATLSSSAGPTPLATQLPSEPTAVFTDSDGTLKIACATAIYELTADNDTYTVRPAVRPFPATRLRAVDVAELSVTVGDRKLSRSYGAGASPAGADLRAITGDFAAGYTRLAAEAAGMGRFVQPVLARCSYYDRAGRLLHRTAPTIVAAPSGAQLTDGVTLRNSDATTVAAYTLRADTFRIEATTEADPEGRVASLVVEVSPQFHTWSPTSPTVFTALRDSSQGIGRLTPGGAVTAATAATVMQALARIDAVCTPAATLSAPGSTGTTATVTNTRGTDIAAEVREFGEALGKTVSAASPMECLLSAPHSFGAATMARSGGIWLWGGLHAVRFGGYSPAEYAAATGTGSWRALVVTWFGNGSRAVRASFEGTGDAPASLAPLVCYPAPDATRMSVIIHSGDTTRRADYALQPTPCGRFSASVSAGLKPVVPAVVSAALIVDTENADEDFVDALAVSDASNPLALTAVASSGAGQVACVAAASGSDSSWEFGRHRFVAACASALLSATVSGTGCRRLTLRALASRGATSAQALCTGPAGVYAAVDGALLLVGNDARRVRTLWSDTYRTLSLDSARGELTAVKADGARVFVISAGHGSYRRTGLDGCGAATVGDDRFFTSSGALILPENDRNERVAVEYELYADYGEATPRRTTAFGARLSATDSIGTVAIAPANDAGTADGATVLTFKGSPRHPLRGACHGRPASGALMRLTAAGKHIVFNHFTVGYL